MSEKSVGGYRGQEQAAKVQPPERPSKHPAIPPVSSGKGTAGTTRQLDLLEAILILTELKNKVEVEEWKVPQMKRPVLAGITMCIQRLHHETTKR